MKEEPKFNKNNKSEDNTHPSEAGLTINELTINELTNSERTINTSKDLNDTAAGNEQPFIISGLPEPRIQFTAHSDYLIDRETDDETDE